jgi:polysaccharide export outer membrane protein
MKSTIYLLFGSILLVQCAVASGQQVQPVVPVRQREAAPAVPVQTAPVVPTSAGYRIGTEDALQISVWKEPTLSGAFPVRPDGIISISLIGEVQAAGKTPQELSADIQERLKKYIQDPLVTVVVTAANSQKIFLLGEVLHVGPIPLTPGLGVLQAISASGGLTPYANAKKMYILRTVNGQQTKIPVDYRKALKGEGAAPPALIAGDTVVVP